MYLIEKSSDPIVPAHPKNHHIHPKQQLVALVRFHDKPTILICRGIIILVNVNFVAPHRLARLFGL